MTETESVAPKRTEEDRDPAGKNGDADPKPSPGDRGEASSADGDCAIDLDSARDRAS